MTATTRDAEAGLESGRPTGDRLSWPARLAALTGSEGAAGAAERTVVGALVLVIALGLTLYILDGAFFGPPTAILQRSMFYSLAASAGLLLAGARMRRLPLRLALYVLAVGALLPGPYLYDSFFDIVQRGAIAEPIEEALFVVTVITVLALVRVYIGWTMIVLSALALLYAYFGNLIPGVYGNVGYSTSRLTSALLLSTDGIFGVPMGVAAQYIFLFSLFGAVLIRSGLGEMFVQISYAITGRIQGGPGLAAVVSSTLFGCVNGSAVAGVVTTGTFAIPLMKRTGYRPAVAGAIEAASCSAGQILPPVMGAAAFLMAELTEIPYGTIAISALAPALLYVLAVLVAVRLEAGRDNLGRIDDESIPKLGQVLKKRAYMLTPLLALIAGLALGYTPMRSAAYAILMALVIAPWSKATRLSPWQLLELGVETVRITIGIIAAVAAAGILIGVLTLTGLALQASSLILAAGGSSLFLVLLYTMIASFILGMGMPTSAAYLLLAILVAPAVEKFGVPILSGHMFIFYYGLVSAITPPVALAAYAGAAIAQSDPTETAFEAIRLGFVKLVVPFLFIYSPGILLFGGAGNIAGDIAFAAAGVFGLATAFSGWLSRPLGIVERLALTLAAVACLMPTAVPVDLVVVYAIRVAGTLALVLLVWRLTRRAGAVLTHKA
jgi:TRAP transporter 4TM/12TM fusion protein